MQKPCLVQSWQYRRVLKYFHVLEKYIGLICEHSDFENIRNYTEIIFLQYKKWWI